MDRLLFFLITTYSWEVLASVYPSGPMAGKPISIAWGAKTLSNYTGFSAQQFAALAEFSSQSELLISDKNVTIWDYFPMVDESQNSITNWPILQDPLEQDPTAMVATACDTCNRMPIQNLVNLPANSSDWTVIWSAADTAYRDLLADPSILKDDNATNFKMAMNWYTSPGKRNSTNPTTIPSLYEVGIEFGSRSEPDSICSTLYLEGLTGIDARDEREIRTMLPRYFQDLSVQCGCDPLNSGEGSAGSPFRGGWKVVMRGLQEAWRFRWELYGAGCRVQLTTIS